MPTPLDPAALSDNIRALRVLLLQREDAHAAELATARAGLQEQVLRNELRKARLAKRLRDMIEHPAPCSCPRCGGSLRPLGEDVTEVLEYVPGAFRVTRHGRPKLSCRCCEAIAQAPAPNLPRPANRLARHQSALRPDLPRHGWAGAAGA